MQAIFKLFPSMFLLATGVFSFAKKADFPNRIEILGIELIKIPPGKFTAGIKNQHKSLEPYDGVRLVEITKPFYLSTHEVTQAVWKKVMKVNPSHFKGEDRPVENLTWKQCMSFCATLNANLKNFEKSPEGMIFRLPSEVEWEHGVRSGTEGIYFFGDDPADIFEYGWISDNSGGKTHPVMTKKPNSSGLFDVYGNVREWCLDGYEPRPRKKLTDPLLGWKNMDKVNRGGSWDSCDDCCKTGRRTNFGKDYKSSDLGFRLALGFELKGM